MTAATYQHEPKFCQFAAREGLCLREYETFGKAEHQERRELVLALADKVWSPSRLEAYRP